MIVLFHNGSLDGPSCYATCPAVPRIGDDVILHGTPEWGPGGRHRVMRVVWAPPSDAVRIVLLKVDDLVEDPVAEALRLDVDTAAA
jgi:hypothetical protein